MRFLSSRGRILSSRGRVLRSRGRVVSVRAFTMIQIMCVLRVIHHARYMTKTRNSDDPTIRICFRIYVHIEKCPLLPHSHPGHASVNTILKCTLERKLRLFATQDSAWATHAAPIRYLVWNEVEGKTTTQWLNMQSPR